MPADAPTVRTAEPEELAYVETLLRRNDLPVADVRAAPARFYVATVDGERVGVGGVERHGSHGLLRSVVVAEPFRGRGYGAAICDELESRARERGIGALYLLTTTAAGFFRRRGYERIDREDVPDGVRSSREFAELCPASATPLRKPLR